MMKPNVYHRYTVSIHLFVSMVGNFQSVLYKNWLVCQYFTLDILKIDDRIEFNRIPTINLS